MAGNKTFTIIKPDAFKASYSGPIIEIIENAGFIIKNMRLVEMDNTMASKFYAVHKERPFFSRLCEYMCSGPIIVIELEKENAVSDFRKLIDQQIQRRQRKELLEKDMLHLLKPMQFMGQTQMKMLK